MTAEGPESTPEYRTIFARTKAIDVVCEKTLSRHFSCLVTWIESCPVCIFIIKMCAKCHILAELLMLPLCYLESGSTPRSPLSGHFRSVTCCFVFSSRISGGFRYLGSKHHTTSNKCIKISQRACLNIRWRSLLLWFSETRVVRPTLSF